MPNLQSLTIEQLREIKQRIESELSKRFDTLPEIDLDKEIVG